MYTFFELIKKIRQESGLTQKEFAKVLSVSTILISMIEVEQKQVSKNLIIKLSKKLEVNPSSITPFLLIDKNLKYKNISNIEKNLIRLGEKLQIFLIKHKSKNLKKHISNRNRYPKIRIRSKNELAKRISGKNFPFNKALNLINDVLKNYNQYWYDVEIFSEPAKGKYVRSAKGTPLGKLMSLIDKKVLAPYDVLVPDFIFGGVSKKSHIQATYHLLGKQRKRTKLSLDISRFFEQNKRKRVFHFFNKKCECSVRAANILADLCCVPFGPKGSKSSKKVIARGFATSTRLALWCNLDLFFKIYWEAKRVLKNKDAKIAIFIDDIGITASRIKKEKMELLYKKIEKIFSSFDSNQILSLNPKKKDIKSYLDQNIEHLGLKMGRNKISIGSKIRRRQDKIKQKLKDNTISKLEKKKLMKKKKSYISYKDQIKKINMISKIN